MIAKFQKKICGFFFGGGFQISQKKNVNGYKWGGYTTPIDGQKFDGKLLMKKPWLFWGVPFQHGEGRIVYAQMSSSLELLKYQTAPKPRFLGTPPLVWPWPRAKVTVSQGIKVSLPQPFLSSDNQKNTLGNDGKWQKHVNTCQYNFPHVCLVSFKKHQCDL